MNTCIDFKRSNHQGDEAFIIDGRQHASLIKQTVKTTVKHIQAYGIKPGLAVLIVGNDTASHIYVDAKCQQSQEVGIKSVKHTFADTVDEKTLSNCIKTLNEDPHVHGILIQLPLPTHINANKVLISIDPKKDIDGLHPQNIGLLNMGYPYMIPCTPLGCLRILKNIKPDWVGAKVVLIGASILIGKPLVPLLLNEGCTVTVTHKKTHSIDHECQQADVIITAAGVPRLVKQSWVKSGAVVIDVGINRIVDDQGKSQLVGDADFDHLLDRASAITPVPGGVGPMTVACLLENCVKACVTIHQLPIELPAL